MIVKILKSSQTFAGINYNENKNEKGASELLVAQNFGLIGAELKKSDYVKYMEAVCKTNDRVKNVQFHATISCKGNEYDFDQLKDIALQYIEKMGYINNPFLIYSHKDTLNNHVHIVSTRVDKLGNKIDDSFENIRSQKIMNEILKVDIENKAKQDQILALKYNFSTIAQYKLLLEQRGWKVIEKDDAINLIKNGIKQSEILIYKVKEKINAYSPDKNRRNQLTALFFKYKQGLNHIQLQELLRNKFGVELIFHKGKGHDKPYGYTVVDHSSFSVFKGSEIMDIKNLLVSPERQQKIDNCNLIVSQVFNENHTLDSFTKAMKNLGYSFHKDGSIVLENEKGSLYKLDKKYLSILRYNSRIEEAQTFSPKSQKEAKVLSRLFFVKPEDIQIDKKVDFIAHDMYSDLMKSYINNPIGNIQERLDEKQILFLKYHNELYLVDKLNRVLISSQDLHINLESNKIGFKAYDLSNLNYEKESFNKVQESTDNILDSIIGLLSAFSSHDEDDSKKRKKKYNNNNI